MPQDPFGDDCRSPRWYLVGRRLHFYAGDLSSCPFPGRRSCQLQVWPSRCKPGSLCLFFARSHHAYCRMSSLLVTSVLWPRYAREKFVEAGRAALKTVKQLVSAHVQASIDPATAPSETEKIRSTFDQQLSVLRSLLQAGARESTYFSVRLSNYNAFLVSLTNLFPAGLYLSRHRVEPWFLDHIRQETESLLAAISDEFNILTTARPSASAPLQTAIAFVGHISPPYEPYAMN
jgi:hypothetical protein